MPLKQYKDGTQAVEITHIVGHRKVAKGHRLLARCAPTDEFPQGEIDEFHASDLAKSAAELTFAYAKKHKLDNILRFFLSDAFFETGGGCQGPGISHGEYTPIRVPKGGDLSLSVTSFHDVTLLFVVLSQISYK